MKKLLVIALIFFTKSAFAQKDTVGMNIPVTAGGIVYEKVFDAPGMSKNLLYSNAKVFFIKQHNDKYGNKLQDSVLYRVIGKDNQSVTIEHKGFLAFSPTFNLNFLLQIDCKDNKYRCRIYNITRFDNVTPPTGGPAVPTISSAEDIYTSYMGGKKENPSDFFAAVNIMVHNELQAVQNSMADKDDF